MVAMAGLLIPTAYAMLRGNFLLAGVCVCGIVAARFLVVPGSDSDEPR